MWSGNLNFLETSGPLQACNRTALPLPKKSSNRVFTFTIKLSYLQVINLFFCRWYLYPLITSASGSSFLCLDSDYTSIPFSTGKTGILSLCSDLNPAIYTHQASYSRTNSLEIFQKQNYNTPWKYSPLIKLLSGLPYLNKSFCNQTRLQISENK